MTKTVSLAEAARLVHVDYKTVRYWVKTGRLPVSYVRTESAKQRTPNPKVRTGGRVSVEDLRNCLFRDRARNLKRDHPDLNLISIPELSSMMQRGIYWCYGIVDKFQLKKYYIDGVAYMISGEELYEKAQEDPYYAQIFLHK